MWASMTERTRFAVVLYLASMSIACHGFIYPLPSIALSASTSLDMLLNTRDADRMESWVGGERYEMVPLPDSMVDQTVFVGNLCEFVQDGDLSRIFSRVSHLQSVPACVARRANMASLQYGFVTFPCAEEKEAAILRLDGVEFMGRKLRVEEIRDDPRRGRVKVPEKIVSYVLGAAKKTRKNTGRLEGGLRRIARLQEPQRPPGKGSSSEASNSEKRQRRASSFGSSSSYLRLLAKLSDADREEFSRATRRGFVSLNIGTGCSRSRIIAKSRLITTHRQWCDEREKPQIVHCKSFSRAGPQQSIDSDCVIVDLSPLRITAAVMGAEYDANDWLVRWKAQIVTVAATVGMELRALLDDDNDLMDYEVYEECEIFFDNSDECDNEEDQDLQELVSFDTAVPEFPITQGSTKYTIEMSGEDSWANQPISRLPVLSMGEFEGERTNAKAMARELALLWDLPEEGEAVELECSPASPAESRFAEFASQSTGGRGANQKKDRKKQNRRRRRNDSRDMDFFLF